MCMWEGCGVELVGLSLWVGVHGNGPNPLNPNIELPLSVCIGMGGVNQCECVHGNGWG